MVSSMRTSGCTRLQHVQREMGTCGGSARAGTVVEVRAGVVAGVVSASQGRMTGLALWIMGVIQVRFDDDDDDAKPDGGPDVIVGIFWIPKKDGCSNSPFMFSNAAELEPEV
jgi:hypothetical protein